MKQKLINFSVLMAFVWIVTACSGFETALQSVEEPFEGEAALEESAAASETSEPAATLVVEAEYTEAEHAEAEHAEAEGVSVAPTATEATVESNVAEEPNETLPEEMAVPAPRTDLYATDPAAVSLASGDVQLVEMFAFW